MIVHSFVTDGYYDFAIGLIESFKRFHGEEIPFILHSKDLDNARIKGLKDRYKNLTVLNTSTDWQWLAATTGCTKQELMNGKRLIENNKRKYTRNTFYYWKHYISIYERYKRALSELFDIANSGDNVLHLDIDTYVNRPLDTIFNLIKTADVSILLRPNYKPEWRKTFGCILGFTVNESSRRFLETYHTIINKHSFCKIPKGWGQTALWRAYCQVKDDKSIRVAQIPKNWVDKGFSKRAFLLAANIGIPKVKVAIKYKDMAQT